MVKKWMKRILALAMVLLMAMPVAAMAESAPYDVPELHDQLDGVIPYGSTQYMNVGEENWISIEGSIKTAKSSKKKVASVDNSGHIIALSEGKTKITVTNYNRGKLVFTLVVTDPYAPSSVDFGGLTQVNLIAGQWYQLTPQLYPSTAKTVFTWKSSKKKVVEVDGTGVIHTLKTGTAKITVTTSNKKKAVLVVNVRPNKADGIYDVPSNMSVSMLGYNNWSVWPKSIEFNGTGLVCEYYLLNNVGKSVAVDMDYFYYYYPNGWYTRCSYYQKVSCNRGKFKKYKVTFKGAEAGGLDLTAFNPRSIDWEWSGTLWYR